MGDYKPERPPGLSPGRFFIGVAVGSNKVWPPSPPMKKAVSTTALSALAEGEGLPPVIPEMGGYKPERPPGLSPGRFFIGVAVGSNKVWPPSPPMKKAVSTTALSALAEGEGFEPPDLLQSTVFKTAALNRSATPPVLRVQKYASQRNYKAILKKINSPAKKIFSNPMPCRPSKTPEDMNNT
jgi:hypothetical protein